ncbi:hypothetical protein ACIPYQ_05300 [Streptomyces sp. NPDC090045]|uniref:hypothetical protein n=1 Tax=Streptomyces sp. NPDC090045 TaxID=3365927 RepID=UPI0038022905
MVHDLHAPAPAPKRHIARLGMGVTAAAFVSAAIAVPASAAIASPAQSTAMSVRAVDPNAQPDGQCKSGYVWRDSFEGDGLCVTPSERDTAKAQNPNRQPGSNECQPGYVWREAWDGDAHCVTPAERAKAKAKAKANVKGQLIDNGPKLTGIPGR